MTAALRMTAISVMLFMLVSATACTIDKTPEQIPQPNPVEEPAPIPNNKLPDLDLDLDLDGNDKIDNNWDKEDKK